MLNINPMVSFVLEGAHAHVRSRDVSFRALGLGKVVSYEPSLVQLGHQVDQQVLLEDTVRTGDDDIHVSTSLLSTTIGATNLSPVANLRTHSPKHPTDILEHPSDFLPVNPNLKIVFILQAQLLIPSQPRLILP